MTIKFANDLVRLDGAEEVFVQRFLHQVSRYLGTFRRDYHKRFNYWPGSEVTALLEINKGIIKGYIPLPADMYCERVKQLSGG